MPEIGKNSRAGRKNRAQRERFFPGIVGSPRSSSKRIARRVYVCEMLLREHTVCHTRSRSVDFNQAVRWKNRPELIFPPDPVFPSYSCRINRQRTVARCGTCCWSRARARARVHAARETHKNRARTERKKRARGGTTRQAWVSSHCLRANNSKHRFRDVGRDDGTLTQNRGGRDTRYARARANVHPYVRAYVRAAGKSEEFPEKRVSAGRYITGKARPR